MAVAEARAAWQRTANRFLIQEDAKRLASSSSVPPSKHDDPTPTPTPNLQDIPNSNSLPFTPNMSPSSRWWLQMQPSYELQKGLLMEGYDSGLDDQCRNLMDDSPDALKLGFQEDFKGLRGEGFVSVEVSNNSNDVYFDSERSTRWWRTADSEELALIVAQRSLDLIENCDLPMPQKIGKTHHHFNSAPPSLTSPSQHLRIDKLLSPIEKRKACDEEGSKAELLEALRHSQTRAREAEKVAKEACAEKEDVLKLVFRQASLIFAYKHWLQLLQLENMMYFQFKNNQTPSPTRSRKRGKRSRCEYNVGKYAIVFALGLGLVGAGLFLGWSIGWMMLPTW